MLAEELEELAGISEEEELPEIAEELLATSEEELCGTLEDELAGTSEELEAGTSCLATPAAANSGA